MRLNRRIGDWCPSGAGKRTHSRRPCSAAARSGRCGFWTGLLPVVWKLGLSLSPRIGVRGARVYRLATRRWVIGFEIQVQRAEGKPRLELEHDVAIIVG